MKKLLCIALGICLAACAFVGCEDKSLRFSSENSVFDIDELKEVSFIEKNDKAVDYIYGNNVTTADYAIAGSAVVFKVQYLVTLDEGKYEFTAVSDAGEGKFELTVAEGRSYKVANGSFETGDLTGWKALTVFKGETGMQAFTQVVGREDALTADNKHMLGYDSAEKTGILRSQDFVVGGSGYITYELGGAKNGLLCYLSVRDAETDEELARFANSVYNESAATIYRADLRRFAGRKVFIELCDYGAGEDDYILFDELKTFWETEPAGETAVDILPQFTDLPTNQLYNGDFSQGLDGYTAFDFSGAEKQNVFLTEENTLKSNAGGDAAEGLLRSSLFVLEGSGVISMELGAAQGEKFDKTTYVSVKEYKTNRELFRFANEKSNGNETVKYFLDLSAYLGKICYLEIVDNAGGAWDVIYVSDIRTYYEERPSFDFGQAGQNLNY